MTAAKRTGTPLNQSVERAVKLLGFFSPDEPELTIAQLTTRLGTSKATTHRYALALRHVGLLRHDPASGTYTLGPRVVELAATALAGLRIIKIAGPHMERLVQEVNETVVLSIWDGEAPIVMRVEDNTDRIVRIAVRTGARLPLDSAQGKVFAAFNGQIDGHDLSARELARVRSTRVAVNSRVVEGIRVIATPVFQEQELVAAMAIVGTTVGISERSNSPLALRLIRAAEALTSELGSLRTNERSG
ncbi:MAG: IclR family transcriptional regulator [Actinomycetota bacterium]